MNDETHPVEQKIELSTYSDADLERMIEEMQKELVERTEKRKKEALEKMQEIADSVGMTPEELLGFSAGGKRKRGRRGAIAWQHPDDPDKVYRGGKKPDWMKELEGQGRKPVKVD